MVEHAVCWWVGQATLERETSKKLRPVTGRVALVEKRHLVLVAGILSLQVGQAGGFIRVGLPACGTRDLCWRLLVLSVPSRQTHSSNAAREWYFGLL